MIHRLQENKKLGVSPILEDEHVTLKHIGLKRGLTQGHIERLGMLGVLKFTLQGVGRSPNYGMGDFKKKPRKILCDIQ